MSFPHPTVALEDRNPPPPPPVFYVRKVVLILLPPPICRPWSQWTSFCRSWTPAKTERCGYARTGRARSGLWTSRSEPPPHMDRDGCRSGWMSFWVGSQCSGSQNLWVRTFEVVPVKKTEGASWLSSFALTLSPAPGRHCYRAEELSPPPFICCSSTWRRGGHCSRWMQSWEIIMTSWLTRHHAGWKNTEPEENPPTVSTPEDGLFLTHSEQSIFVGFCVSQICLEPFSVSFRFVGGGFEPVWVPN